MSTLPRRRSDPGQRHLRISFSDCSEEEGARRCSYLVRMIKPNLIGSHDWHVQPSCQRSFDGPPKRCRLDRGLSSNAQVSPNLLRCWFLLIYVRQHFGANFSKLSNFLPHVKTNQELPSRSPQGTAQRKISKSNQHSVLAPLRRAKGVLPFGSCNGLFSAGFPTGVQGVRPTLPQP